MSLTPRAAASLAWVAAALPLAYVVPFLVLNDNNSPKPPNESTQKALSRIVQVLVLIVAVVAAAAAFGLLGRSPLAAVATMIVGAFVAIYMSVTSLAYTMGAPENAKLPPRALALYTLPLAIGAALGSSAAAGTSIAAAFGAPGWASALAAAAVLAAWTPVTFSAITNTSGPAVRLVASFMYK